MKRVTRPTSQLRAMFEMVKEFQTTFECQRFSDIGKADFDYLNLRARLLDEERDEYESAIRSVDILDALCDELYFSLGISDGLSLPLGDYTSQQAKKDTIWIKPSFNDVLSPVTQELRCGFPCPRKTPSYLDHLNARILDIAAIYGFDIMGAFSEVHRNNMKKLWTAPHVPSQENTNTDMVICKPKDGKWLVLRADGKIIKPPGHQPVDLSPYV